MKLILNLVGVIAVALGVLGVFLPLLPTTPFLLLASACFARGSTRLHGWLLRNPVFGQYLSDWEQGKGIPLKGKLAALALMWASLVYSALRTEKLMLQAMHLLVGAAVTVYLAGFVPTHRAEPPKLGDRNGDKPTEPPARSKGA
jgi:hypothetical protein